MTTPRTARLIAGFVIGILLLAPVAAPARSAAPNLDHRPSAVAAPEPPPVFFADVLYGQAFHREISWLADRKITTGYSDNTFRPRWPVSREAMAAFLYRYAGSPAYAPPRVSAFVDVPVTHPFYRQISWLAAKRITTGYSDRTFRPSAAVSREAMAAFLYRYAGSPAYQPAQDNRPAVVTSLPAWQWSQILATGTWRAGCPGGPATLVRVEVPFFGFDGRYHRGAVVVNRDIATDTRAVFDHLAAAKFPVNTVIPVEYFDGWDRVSEAANNTSAFNCRKPAESISALESSPHANGRAFDINPVQNPWIRPGTSIWEPAAGAIWATRRDLSWQSSGVIAKGGIPWTWFTNRGGWQWQGGPVDYMHFDTGYPSVPMSGH